MHDFKNVEKMICKELDEMTESGKLSSGSLDVIHKLTDTYKNLKKIEMLEGKGGEYSERGSYEGGSYRGYYRGGSYGDEDYSGRRMRDSRGRYMDSGRDHIIAKMGELMSIASSEEERDAIESALRKLQH